MLFRSFVLSIAATLAVFVPSGSAQDPRGTILGRVSDSTGAVIPNAVIRATNAATGVSATATTNAAGSYTLPYLIPGTYTVSAELTGFKRFVREGVQVRVSEAIELNIPMEIGQVTETVEVTAQSPLLDTSSPSLGQVIDERRVTELPTLAGNAFELALLTPGVMNGTNLRDRKPAFNNGNSQISTDGNGTYNNEFQIDGVTNTFADGGARARVVFSPPQTSIQEFKMQTATYDASIGHTIGSVVNVSTKSGTNQLHGEAHWFTRNSAFDAPNFFNNKAGTEPPKYRDNRYGASAGGPVYLPKLYDGRNKTFWFHAWEANKWGVPGNFTGTVPTPDQRRGDFSGLLGIPGGSNYQIYDPATTTAAAGGRFRRQPFAGNIIPTSRLDPVGTALVNLYPQPNSPGTADGRNNFFNPSNVAAEDYYVHITRVDHAFSEKFRTFVRVHYDWWEEDKNDHFANRINGIILNRINRGLALDNVFVLNPSLLLNVRYGFTNQEFPERRVTQGYDLASLNFSPALLGLIEKDLATVPRTSLGAYSQLSPWESGDGTNSSLTHMLSTNFTKLKGTHNLKFGSDFRVGRAFGARFPFQVSPDLNYNASYTRGPLDNDPAAQVGQELASMLLGIPAGTMERSASYAIQSRFLGVYLHDDFKLTPKFTLNLGLRYEKEWPITERYDRLVSGFAFDTANPIEAQASANYARNPIPELPVDAFRVLSGLTYANAGGNPRSPFDGESNNVMPRVGFAWQLDNKTVLRAGAGLFYDLIGINRSEAIQTGFSQSTPIQASLDSGLTYVANNANPFPNGLLAPLGAAGGLTTNLRQDVEFYLRSRKHGYSQRWSFGLQRQIGEFLMEASYVGNRGTRLGVLRDLNETPAQYLSQSPVRDQATINFLGAQFPNPFRGTNPIYPANISRGDLLKPYPHFGRITVEQPIGYNWYHSLQVRAEKRFSKGFTFQLAYTWSKLMEAVEFLNRVDPAPTEAISGLDRPHRIAASFIYELPFGRGRWIGSNLPAAVNFIAGGWQLNGVIIYQSGQALGFGNALFSGNIQDIALPSGERNADRWFNTEAGFNRNNAQQLASNLRTLPPRFSGIRGDSQHRWDLSALKNFRIRESARLQFRAEAFNALNHTILNNPQTSPTNSAFGRITGTAASARTFQLALKLEF
ncbi:MAG: carboxypeptidase-like regulatory domain-containing protein [Bryobacteraceae bacterium]